LKLRTLKPMGTLRPSVAYAADVNSNDRRIMAPPPWKRWYNTPRWRRLRMEVFCRDVFRCQMCGKLEGDTSKLVADHRKAHRGRPELFWDPQNIQTLCADPCHNTLKQREEAAAGPAGVWD
jgi:5-methylcytosine-specific restriction enzyme A